MRASQSGFFLTDWFFVLFEGSLWRVLWRFLLLGGGGYLLLAVGPHYHQAWALHDILVRAQQDPTFLAQSRAEAYQYLDAQFQAKGLAVAANEVVHLTGQGASRAATADYVARVSLAQRPSATVSLEFGFCFDATTSKTKALWQVSCEK